MKKPTMNEDIKKYPIFILTPAGTLQEINWITSTRDYNHSIFNMHHFIEKQHYNKNEDWYKERGIEQFLILLPISTHEQIHNIAIKNLSDDDFYGFYKISRWDLVFNKKHSKY